ncbi:MAG: hypothetical protein IPG34_14465 [Rhodocyclaceae bacterium]|nr:hypothetical protein [Rhodocyclaceae bacterium]
MTYGVIVSRVLTAALLVSVGTVNANQALGEGLPTLFYSPIERKLLSSAREGSDGAGVNAGTALSVTGLVKRGSAKSTVWLNGTSLREGELAPSGEVPRIGKRSIEISAQEVRVGETLDLESGARTDFVPDGSVTTRKQK